MGTLLGRWLLLATMLLAGLRGQAQVLTPTKLSAALIKPTAEVGREMDLLVNARIDKNWHLYATDFDPELGPTVFTFNFTKSAAFELVGPPVSVGTKKKHDDVFNGTISYFEGTGQIRQRIRLLRPGTLSIKAEVEYQTCTDVDGRCVPGAETLTFGPLAVSGPAVAAASAQPAAPAAAAPKARPATPVAGAATVVEAATVPAATADGLWSFGLLAFLSGLAALLNFSCHSLPRRTLPITGPVEERRRARPRAGLRGPSRTGLGEPWRRGSRERSDAGACRGKTSIKRPQDRQHNVC